MYQKQTHAVLARKLLHPADNVIVVGVAVSVCTDFPDFLQGIDNNQPGVWVLPNELFQLFIQSRPQLLGANCEMELVRALHAEHPGHSLLQSLVVIFQRQVKHRALVDFILP